MSEEEKKPEKVEAKEAPVVDTSALQAELKQMKQDFEAVLSKNQELLGETKKAKEAKRAAEEADKERAVKNGEFEKLLKLEQEEKAKILEQYTGLQKNILNEKINSQAHQIANELKAIPESAGIMADLIAREIRMIAEEDGSVSETALKTLKQQFSNDDKYKPLLMGNLSNGGGATGAKNGVQQKGITKAEYEGMNVNERNAYHAKHGKVQFID